MTEQDRHKLLTDVLGKGNFSAIARDTGLSVSHVSRVLRGITNPSLDTMRKIVEATNLSLDVVNQYIEVCKGLKGGGEVHGG